MKRLTAIFAIAALAGCSPANDAPTSPTLQHLQTMMSADIGDYTVTPNRDSPYNRPIMNVNAWDLAVKLNQYRKGKNLCAEFQTIIVNVSNGQYLLPYQRMTASEQTSVLESIQVELKDFNTSTLLNIPARLPDPDRHDNSFALTSRVREVCVPQYNAEAAP